MTKVSNTSIAEVCIHESAKLRVTRACLSYMPHTLRVLLTWLVPYVLLWLTCLLPYVSSCLTCLVPHLLSCLTCYGPYLLSCLTCLTYSWTLRVLCLVFSPPACASYRTCSFAPHPSLASGVSSLTYSYASHVS